MFLRPVQLLMLERHQRVITVYTPIFLNFWVKIFHGWSLIYSTSNEAETIARVTSV